MTGKDYQHGEGSSIIVKSLKSIVEKKKRILIFINLILLLISIIFQKNEKIC